MRFVLTSTTGDHPLRAGAARNTAVRASSGQYLALLDADDIMHPDRLSQQLQAARRVQESSTTPDLVLLGCRIERIPADATERYTAWANNMSQEQLWTHQFRECTLLTPCWFMPRALWEAVGGMPSNAAQMHAALPLLGTAGPLPFWNNVDISTAVVGPAAACVSSQAQPTQKRQRKADTSSGIAPSGAEAPPAQGYATSSQKLTEVLTDSVHSAAAASAGGSDASSGGGVLGGGEGGAKRARADSVDLGGSARFTPAQLAGPTGTVPEDLAFFLKACALGVTLHRVDAVLMQYRHTQGSASSRTPRKVLQRIRAAAFDQRVCSSALWRQKGFYIWGSGRDGRVLYKSLCKDSRMAVRAFLDVSEQRIEQNYHHKDLRETVRVCHFEDPSLEPLPIVTAVALDRTDGEFEDNLQAIASKWHLQHGSTLWHFV